MKTTIAEASTRHDTSAKHLAGATSSAPDCLLQIIKNREFYSSYPTYYIEQEVIVEEPSIIQIQPSNQ